MQINPLLNRDNLDFGEFINDLNVRPFDPPQAQFQELSRFLGLFSQSPNWTI